MGGTGVPGKGQTLRIVEVFWLHDRLNTTRKKVAYGQTVTTNCTVMKHCAKDAGRRGRALLYKGAELACEQFTRPKGSGLGRIPYSIRGEERTLLYKGAEVACEQFTRSKGLGRTHHTIRQGYWRCSSREKNNRTWQWLPPCTCTWA